jgi:hypothetical protein
MKIFIKSCGNNPITQGLPNNVIFSAWFYFFLLMVLFRNELFGFIFGIYFIVGWRLLWTIDGVIVN